PAAAPPASRPRPAPGRPAGSGSGTASRTSARSGWPARTRAATVTALGTARPGPTASAARTHDVTSRQELYIDRCKSVYIASSTRLAKIDGPRPKGCAQPHRPAGTRVAGGPPVRTAAGCSGAGQRGGRGRGQRQRREQQGLVGVVQVWLA